MTDFGDDAGSTTASDAATASSDANDMFDIGTGATTNAADAADADACAAVSQTATLVPLDIFIMQDQSGSMIDVTSDGTMKWAGVKNALATFMADSASAGIGMGIGYFPLASSTGGGDDSCLVSDYAKPDVEIAPLPAVAVAINASLAAHSPSTGTPTGPALQGAISHAQAWRAAHPDHQVIVLLATDGQPNECTPQDIPGIAKLASAALGATPSIPTYVIGVLTDLDISNGADVNLNQLSRAGNGADAFIIRSAKDSVEKTFVAAMSKIRGTSLACQYVVPTGVGVDYKKVNVNLTDAAGKTSVIPYVGDVTKCDPTAGGWYYDVDPTKGTPTKILMCATSCTTLTAAVSAKIEIAVGCETVTTIRK